MPYSTWRWLDSLKNYERTPGYKFDLSAYRELLRRLGDPQEKLKNPILVGGTKGKGSTCTLLDSGLRGCGLTTGLFTSPHLLSVRERIRVSGGEIPESDFTRILAEVAKNARGLDPPPTWFEVLTAVAFLYFIEKSPEYVILEVGLGGRLDATNVVHPLISVITRIGLDHTELLGDTIAKIASEEAGIIHPCSVVVSASQPDLAYKVLRAKAAEEGVELHSTRELRSGEMELGQDGTSFTVYDEKPHKLFIRLLGHHQVENTLTAWLTLKLLKGREPQIAEEGVIEGLKTAWLPARCQLIPGSPKILLDSAHTPDSIEALRQTASQLFPNLSPIIVLGFSKGKLVREMFEILEGWPSLYILTQARSPRAYSASALKEYIKGAQALIVPRVPDAIQTGIHRAQPSDLLIITGSFFVAGEAIDFLRSEGSLT